MSDPVVWVKIDAETKAFDKAVERSSKQFQAEMDKASKQAAKQSQKNFENMNKAAGNALAKYIGYEAVKKVLEVSARAVKAFTDGAIENSKKLGGEVDRVTKSYDRFLKGIGDATSKSNGFRGIMDSLNTTLNQMSEWASSPDGGKAVNDFFLGLAGMLATSLEGAIALKKIFRDIGQWADKKTQGPRNYLTAANLLMNPGDTASKLADSILSGSNPFEALGFDTGNKPYVEGNTPAEQELLKTIANLRGIINGGSAAASRPAPRGGEYSGPLAIPGGADLYAQRVAENADKRHAYIQASLATSGAIQRYQQDIEIADKLAQHSAAKGREYFAHALAMAQKEQKLLEERKQTWMQFGAQIAATIGDHFSQMVANVASGTASLGEALAGMLGGIMTTLGQMLIQLGTAAILAGTLSVIPIFSGIVGPPGVSAAAGVAMVAAGAGMVAAGTAIGGLAAPGAPTTANPGGGPYGATGPTTTSPTGFWMGAGADSGQGNRTVIVNFNGSVFGGDRKRAARELGDILQGAGA